MSSAEFLSVIHMVLRNNIHCIEKHNARLICVMVMQYFLSGKELLLKHYLDHLPLTNRSPGHNSFAYLCLGPSHVDFTQ